MICSNYQLFYVWVVVLLVLSVLLYAVYQEVVPITYHAKY